MFLSLSRDSGFSKKSTAPSLTARMTSAVDAPSAISTTGVSSKESTKERPTASSGATMHDCKGGGVDEGGAEANEKGLARGLASGCAAHGAFYRSSGYLAKGRRNTEAHSRSLADPPELQIEASLAQRCLSQPRQVAPLQAQHRMQRLHPGTGQGRPPRSSRRSLRCARSQNFVGTGSRGPREAAAPSSSSAATSAPWRPSLPAYASSGHWSWADSAPRSSPATSSTRKPCSG